MPIKGNDPAGGDPAPEGYSVITRVRGPRASSSAASSPTCCPRASTASGTANGGRADNVAKARELLAVPPPVPPPDPECGADDGPRVHPRACPCCGGRMLVIEVFERGQAPRHSPTPLPLKIDTS